MKDSAPKSAKQNYEQTRNKIGYVPRKEAKNEDYKRIGFKSGLEVHQQLKTKEKLFCHCPAGIYHDDDEYDAEIIRHMRPTLSELGEYDGTALMEYKTRKEIIYRINNQTACTYEIDDTPPFQIDKEALDIALEISLLCKLNIVGEVHVTRKQYLDGSIPTGFQRTAIIGVEGEIPLKHKKVRLIQLSLEEDSCREISDIRHTRTFKTDRLGIPLIETVTYPDMLTPDELREGAEYIRFLNRSTGKVRTGIGTGREDVNVSCEGGTRVEMKGLSHNKWIPELSHNEAFRQWALLHIIGILNEKINQPDSWKIQYQELDPNELNFYYQPINEANKNGEKIYAVNLPQFKYILSHFTQPGKMFADEIYDRLKVIACLETPFMIHTEEFENNISQTAWDEIRKKLKAQNDDAQIIFWGPDEDISTALETIEERCKMAFEGVPRETRKTFPNGTTIFERVLPGPDRMYPDTDTAPIPLDKKYIDNKWQEIPEEIISKYQQLKKWEIPEDTYNYIFSKNLYPVIRKIVEELDYSPKFIGTFIGQTLKYVEGHYPKSKNFTYTQIFNLFKYLEDKNIKPVIAKKMLPYIYKNPNKPLEEILEQVGYKKIALKEIKSQIPELKKQFDKLRVNHNTDRQTAVKWIMGKIHHQAIGNVALSEIKKEVENQV
jgi:glutamyl-tRNA(Gln) amidotransferase subunit E